MKLLGNKFKVWANVGVDVGINCVLLAVITGFPRTSVKAANIGDD